MLEERVVGELSWRGVVGSIVVVHRWVVQGVPWTYIPI